LDQLFIDGAYVKKMQSYVIAKIPVVNKKWVFKKGIGLLSVNHIRNTALPPSWSKVRATESFTT
jgi:hypothetical protein